MTYDEPMATAPTAFVAGATGYVGGHVVAVLRERGAVVAAHVRPDSPRLERARARLVPLGAEVDTTPWDAAAMAATLRARAPTHVFALVGTTLARTRRDPLRLESYASVDLGLTRVLLDACSGLEQPPRFVYLSSVGAGPRAWTRYARVRWQTEEAVRASGLPYTIARPSLITGPDREESRPHERLAAALSGPPLALLRRLWVPFAERYRPVTGRELAERLVQAAFNFSTIDRVVTGEELRYESPNQRRYYFPRTERDVHGN